MDVVLEGVRVMVIALTGVVVFLWGERWGRKWERRRLQGEWLKQWADQRRAQLQDEGDGEAGAGDGSE